MHPLPEYPRPSMRRDSYVNLNGPWDYAITQSSEFPAKWDGAILVPYSPEAKASGVGRTLQPGQWLHYHRTFTPPAGEGGRVLLHFGAVDYACAVEVNGRLAGGHRGGYWPFTLDITDLLRPQGRNTLWVAVQDPTGTGTQARGKQTLRPGGMFYPAQSGIWQTVWLERVPENYIDTLTVTPDYDARTVTVKVHTSKPGGAVNLWAVVRAGGVTIAEDWGSDEADRDGEVTLNIAEEHFFPWSPDSPFLYDLTVGTTQGEEEGFDTVHSYFALRKWECKEDAKGIRRFFLNGRPILLNGLLDQGYWPEGLYTPPSDGAVEHELHTVRELGFNLLRKHAKIEPERWYYHCDKLGIIVWQDMVNGGGAYPMWYVTYLTNALQPLMRRAPDGKLLWGFLGRGSAHSREEYARELADSTVTVEQLMNDNSPQAIALAEQRLKEMKPNIAGWEADFGKEMMTKNKAWINFTWSGDAVWAIEEADAVGVELDYTVPCEGSNIWYDGWVIPRYARNVKAASYFINYLCQPSVALRNMDAIGYVSAVATPEIMEAKTDTTLDVHSDLSYFFGPLPGADSLQIDPVQYPDRRVVERCAMIRDFGDRTELVLEMWSRVKGDNLNTGIVLLIFAVFGLLFIWLVYAKIRKYKQKRRHRLRRKRKRG